MNAKKTAIFAIFAIAVLSIACLPVQELQDASYEVSAEPSSTITGDYRVATGDDNLEYNIFYSNHDYDSYYNVVFDITYSAQLLDHNGDTVANAISPSTGSITNGGSATLSLNAPDDAGTYTISVDYTAEVSFNYFAAGDEEDAATRTLELNRTYSIRVLDPITLSVTITNNSDIDISNFGVYFYVDDERIDDSYTTLALSREGEREITYDWLAEPSEGRHIFKVLPASGGTVTNVTGLGEEYTFYVGDNDYSMWIILLVVIIIALALVAVWVYRKPVKNYGKPKSRK